MKVLVDTSIWSLVLRRRKDQLSPPEVAATTRLRSLLSEGSVMMIGSIRQELLSGIRDPKQFEEIKRYLRFFPNHILTELHDEEAAACHIKLRKRGVSASAVDCLICAVSLIESCTFWTLDRDFLLYQGVLDISLVNEWL